MRQVTMREFKDLSLSEQKLAVGKLLNNLLQDVCNGSIRFNDELNQDDLQARIDKAIEKADKMQTPWFSHEYVMDAVGSELESMAQGQAEEDLYPLK
jgi:hypothetical protein